MPRLRLAVAAALIASLALPALAHPGAGGGFAAGLAHPLLGWDHVVAMLAVGLWGALLGRPAILVLPLAFPLAMAAGAGLAAAGVPVQGIEAGIAASALVLGLAVAIVLRPPLWMAAIAVAAFAVFHGYAHGLERPAATSPLGYVLGFVAGTGLLHLAGISLGLLARAPLATRAAGALIAVAGLGLLTGTI